MANPRQPPTVVLAIDGLRASALGAYGQTQYETPTFNALASEGEIEAFCYAPTPNPIDLYSRLAKRLVGTPIETLITDEPSVTAPLDGLAASTLAVTSTEVAGVAETITETSQARFWEGAAAALAHALPALAASSGGVAWVHTRGLYGPWDAPADLLTALVDEDDPEVEPVVEPTPQTFADNGSAEAGDARFAASCRYAAQVQTLDACLAGVVDLISGLLEGVSHRLLVCGLRGYPLGEHGRVGGVDHRLYGEQQHTPCLSVGGPTDGRFTRAMRPRTLCDTIASRLGGNPVEDGPVVLASDEASVVRTEDWLLRRPTTAADAPVELYVKPDDRWEQNDVASLEEATAEALLAKLPATLSGGSDVAAPGASY